MSAPRNTKREDRRALVDAGKRYHAAKLAYCYGNAIAGAHEYGRSRAEALYLLECYALGRKKASVEFGHKHAARTKRQEGK